MFLKNAFKSIKEFFLPSKSEDNQSTNKFKYDDIQHALDKILNEPYIDLDSLLDIIYHGDYGPEKVENINRTIQSLQQINENYQIAHDELKGPVENNEQKNENNLEEKMKRIDDINEKIKSIFNVLIHLECNKILIQRDQILSKYIDEDSLSLRLDLLLDDDIGVKSSIDQLFHLLDSNEQLSLQSIDKANEYLSQNKPNIAKHYLRLNIFINDYINFNIGNICYFQNLLSQVQLARNTIKLPNLTSSFSKIDIDQYSTQILNSISKIEFQSNDIQKINEIIDTFSSIVDNNNSKIQEIRQKIDQYKEYPKIEKHYKIIFECFTNCNEIIEKVCSELKTKIEQINQDNEE